jgi:hypothetical protein
VTREELGQVLAFLEAGSGVTMPISAARAEVYFDMLGWLPFDLLKHAARMWLAENQSQYPAIPPVGALLRLCGVTNGEPTPEARALMAYGAAASAVQSAGGYHSVAFDDPIIHGAIRLMGGWPRFCSWPESELQWRKREFERAYTTLCRTGVSAESCGPLTGIMAEVKRIAVDLPPHSQSLIRGELLSEPRRIAGPFERRHS